ncbi:MAG: hypothetical protein WKF66_07810 [Pedobacter sp.]
MNILQSIKAFAGQPITHQLLISLLKGYKRPNDKIHSLLKEGFLSAVKRGIYTPGPNLPDQPQPEPFLLANHLLGPSYVSLDAALSFHGLIPERVYEITSVTTKFPRSFSTPGGLFSYVHLGLPYYAFGIQQVQLSDNQFAMIASPEKSLFDKIVTTSGLTLRSVKSARSYAIENLRIDEDRLSALDITKMTSWLDDAPKKESLVNLIKMMESL